MGYDRLEGERALQQLGAIYELLRLRTNGWLPAMKLVSKERKGSKVSKRYDEAKTPLRRSIESGVISERARHEFDELLRAHGPMGLKRQLDTEIKKLWMLRVGRQVPVAVNS